MSLPFYRSNPWPLAVLLLAVHFGLGLAAASRKSPTIDEYVYINAGAHNLRAREIRFSPEHPPLCILWGALPSLGVDLDWDRGGSEWRLGGAWRDALTASPPDAAGVERSIRSQWMTGFRLLEDWNPGNARRILMRGRAAMMLLSTLTGVVVFLWGCRIAGAGAGFAALFFWATQPALLAHGPLVTTDAGFTLFSTWFFFEMAGLTSPTGLDRLRLRTVRLGLAAAGMVLTKYSFLVTGLVGGVWGAAAALIALRAGERARAARLGMTLSGAVGIMLAAVCAFYLLAFGILPFKPLTDGYRILRMISGRDRFFFLGEIGNHFPLFFAVSLAVKLPGATLGALIMAVAEAVRNRLPSTDSAVRTGGCSLAAPVFFGAGILLLATLLFNNMGVRYVLPVIPLAALVAGVGVEGTRGPLARKLAWLVAGAQAIACLAAFPDYISHMNPAANIRGRLMTLGDSDLDIGQDIAALEARLRSLGLSEAWGYLHPEPVMPRLNPPVRRITQEALETLPPGTLVAVSAYHLQTNPGLRKVIEGISEPPEILHDTIYLYALK